MSLVESVKHPLADTLSVMLPASEDRLLLRACILPGESGRQACQSWIKRCNDPKSELGREFVKSFLPMLFFAVQTHGVELDNTLLTILRTANFREQLRTKTYTRICRDVFSTLLSNELPAIVVKGAALAESVYPHPALRHSHNIELLVQERHLDQVTRLLKPLRFTGSGGTNSHPELTHESGLPLVLHSNLFELPLCRSDLPDVWSRSQEMVLSKVSVHVLAPTDLILHTSAQAAYSSAGESYRWISDLCFTIAKYQKLDWGLLLDCAVKNHRALPLSVMLSYLVAEFEARVPAEFLKRLSTRAFNGESIGWELALFRAHAAAHGSFKKLLRDTKSWRGRALIVRWMLLPSPKYILWVQQTRHLWLLPFYYLYRPVRYVVRQMWFFCRRQIRHLRGIPAEARSNTVSS